MPLQKRTDFVYCVSEVKWKNDIHFLFCCLVCDNVRDVHFTRMSSIYADFFWLDDYKKHELCFRKGTFSVAEFSVKLRRRSTIFCFRWGIKINCNFGMKWTVRPLRLYFWCPVNPSGLGTQCAWHENKMSTSLYAANWCLKENLMVSVVDVSQFLCAMKLLCIPHSIKTHQWVTLHWMNCSFINTHKSILTQSHMPLTACYPKYSYNKNALLPPVCWSFSSSSLC